jgi:photosynthetic reaction center H subunit
MGTGAITGFVDVAQLVLYAFWIFFAGLIYYLARENRREGYPLESHRGTQHDGWIGIPAPKTYRLHDGTEIQVPSGSAGGQHYSAERTYGNEGSPIDPVGNPLLAGVGSGAWAARADHPDMDAHGQPKIRPLAVCPGFDVSENDPDPRGMQVLDPYGDSAGTVRELWVDGPEMMFRYLEVELADGSRRALVPITFCRITRQAVHVHALLATQWGDVPATRGTDTITLLEEEKISAYFGAGLLYAEPHRLEPLV